MKLISWNINSRSNKEILQKQCNFLSSGDFDLIALQEVTMQSQEYFKDYFVDHFSVSSFDLSKEVESLKNNRKYGQIIISKHQFKALNPYRIKIPFPERVLTIKLLNGTEIYTTHVPPGSSNGIIKIEHFEGLYKFLLENPEPYKILCGDFNSPKQESLNGDVVTWGQKINKSGEVRLAINSKWKDDCSAERWDLAERNIIQNHESLNMQDAFRALNGYEDTSCSWFTKRNGVELGRRYDHIFSSTNLNPTACFYDQSPRLKGLSDHSPIIAEIE